MLIKFSLKLNIDLREEFMFYNIKFSFRDKECIHTVCKIYKLIKCFKTLRK